MKYDSLDLSNNHKFSVNGESANAYFTNQNFNSSGMGSGSGLSSEGWSPQICTFDTIITGQQLRGLYPTPSGPESPVQIIGGAADVYLLSAWYQNLGNGSNIETGWSGVSPTQLALVSISDLPSSNSGGWAVHARTLSNGWMKQGYHGYFANDSNDWEYDFPSYITASNVEGLYLTVPYWDLEGFRTPGGSTDWSDLRIYGAYIVLPRPVFI